jgi:hypothetical protein
MLMLTWEPLFIEISAEIAKGERMPLLSVILHSHVF